MTAKGIFKRIGIGVAALLGALALAALYVQLDGIPRYEPVHVTKRVEITPERVLRGRALAGMLCIHCHLNAQQGALTGKRLPDLPPLFGTAYSPNITQDFHDGIGEWTDGELWALLRTGLTAQGFYTPPWMVKLPLMADEDLASIIAFLRSGSPLMRATPGSQPPSEPSFAIKLLTHTLLKPLPLPPGPIVAPPATDAVAYGGYLIKGVAACYSCHSANLATNDDLTPERSQGYLAGGAEFLDGGGHPLFAPNLTFDRDTGIGAWSEAQFVAALRQGITPDGRVLTYPMVPYVELSEVDARAIYAYLKTLPPVRHATPSRFDYGQLQASGAGEQAYNKYGCVACHGANGAGLFDLTLADAKFPSDADLAAWIRDAPRFKPDTKMPRWDGIIAEGDYAPLVQHVRALARAAKGAPEKGARPPF